MCILCERWKTGYHVKVEDEGDKPHIFGKDGGSIENKYKIIKLYIRYMAKTFSHERVAMY